MRQALPAVLLLAAVSCSLERAESGRPPGPPTPADSLARIEEDSTAQSQVLNALRLYYERRSARDWRALRGSFWPGATLAAVQTPRLRGRGRLEIVALDEFLRRAGEDLDRLAVFSESMVHHHVQTYGDVASAWVVRVARLGLAPDSVVAIYGLDVFTLLRNDGEWRITSVGRAGERPGRPLVRP